MSLPWLEINSTLPIHTASICLCINTACCMNQDIFHKLFVEAIKFWLVALWMMRKCFTTHQVVPWSNIDDQILRRDKYSIFQMDRADLWSSNFSGGKDIAGTELGWGGRGEEIEHQDELVLQGLNYKISAGIHWDHSTAKSLRDTRRGKNTRRLLGIPFLHVVQEKSRAQSHFLSLGDGLF